MLARLAERPRFAEEIFVNATDPLRRAARRWPDREAVRDAEHLLTFRELESRVNRVAQLLGRLGVRRGDRVATSLPNSVAHVVAQLAAVRAGAAWVAINRRLAPPEVAYTNMPARAKSQLRRLDADLPRDGRAIQERNRDGPRPLDTKKGRTRAP